MSSKGKQRALDNVEEENPQSALSLASSEGESFTTESSQKGQERPAPWVPAKSWVHFVAGG
jgi:hypothetical protein